MYARHLPEIRECQSHDPANPDDQGVARTPDLLDVAPNGFGLLGISRSKPASGPGA